MIKLLKNKNFWSDAVRLTVPVALQNLLTSSYTLADTLLVSSLGTVALSSVGMIGQWAFLMNMILIGFCSATTVFISQFWGVKDLQKIRHIAGISIILALAVSVIFTVFSLSAPRLVIGMFNSDSQVIASGVEYLRAVAFSYIAIAITNILSAVLRAVENVKLPMYASAFTTVLNIFLDYAMIFGKFGFDKMGVRGAAVATTVSAWAGVVLIVVISFFQKNLLVGSSREFFSFTARELAGYLRKAFPVVLNEGMWGAGTFVYNIIFGNMGYEYFSALTIVRSFENMCMVLFVGICGAASVMIGKSVGSGRIGDAMDDSKRFSVIVPLVSVIISCLIAVFRQPLVGIFNMGSNISAVAMETAVSMMLIYACALPFRMFPYLQIVSVFRSGGDTVNGAKMELFCLWAMSVPATLIAVYVFKAPFLAAYAVMFVFEDLPKGCMCIKYYLSKKWIKPVTAEGIAGLERMLEKEQGERINE